MSKTAGPGSELWEKIREELRASGIDLSELCSNPASDASKIRVVCITPDLTQSVTALGRTSRDQVVMVRLDQETTRKLDAWVETGAVRSRSEAAALFIREGLQVRARELEQLEGALKGVAQARKQLREKARQVLGRDLEEDAPTKGE
jgi:Arc/MetJ-type ribon-helix-helix transcriptional regulator